ncbi:hypothetical protein GCM10010123_13700 [Pilimelia anulata]|uniref:Heme NO-binding domain-containing protein n=1 Tax=Pilimelia anulata TaxID=53371 RepID=A0A8J3F9B4_9ACTN|nr:heme NO-binding domain-containing protein [Pilimelia anulata]GGJ85264.1 hypothetical protein GCM10010123_13700 [Pilimelia anulata]
MHGLIFSQFQRFIADRYGDEVWHAALKEAGQPLTAIYLTTDEYPDGELVALVDAVTVAAGAEPIALLEAFGRFLAPGLMRIYGSAIDPSWRTLDLFEHTEQRIHTVVRARDPNARPPELATRRISPGTVTMTYASARRLCAVARGIAAGVADHYGEALEITEPRCMLHGAPTCELLFTLR